MLRSLVLEFETLDSFQQAFEKDIAHGGVFVPTEEEFSPREQVEIQLDLSFCGKRPAFEAEVVGLVCGGAVQAGGCQGVAVQFLTPASVLRATLAKVAGVEPPPPPVTEWPERPGQARARPRTHTRISASLESRGLRQSASILNLSASGALVIPEGPLVPVGESVVVHLLHPRTGEECSLEGYVVRHAEEVEGPPGLGIAFDDDTETQTSLTLQDLLAAAHARQLGGVNGTLDAMGAPSVVQMFSTYAQCGTLTLTRRAQEGTILLEGGALRHVRLGNVTSLKALARLLVWEEGAFEFRPQIDAAAPQGIPIPIESALLESLQHVDELARLDLSMLPPSATIERAEAIDEELSPLEQSVVDLALSGFSVAQIVDGLPEFDSRIFEALLRLIESKQIRVSP